MTYAQAQIDARNEGRKEGRAEGRREGRTEGIIETLIFLVQKNLLSVKDASVQAAMSEKDFLNLFAFPRSPSDFGLTGKQKSV